MWECQTLFGIYPSFAVTFTIVHYESLAITMIVAIFFTVHTLITKSREAGVEIDKVILPHKVFAKNSEIKYKNGYNTANLSGIIDMKMQREMTIFAINLKRIVTLMKETRKRDYFNSFRNHWS